MDGERQKKMQGLWRKLQEISFFKHFSHEAAWEIWVIPKSQFYGNKYIEKKLSRIFNSYNVVIYILMDIIHQKKYDVTVLVLKIQTATRCAPTNGSNGTKWSRFSILSI